MKALIFYLIMIIVLLVSINFLFNQKQFFSYEISSGYKALSAIDKAEKQLTNNN